MTEHSWTHAMKEILDEIAAQPSGLRYAFPLQHGTMRAGLYAPRDTDPQTPHIQDEIYIVVTGSGEFVKGEKRVTVSAGDLLFVEANIPHRFENFTGDFATWVVFWGPEGGEKG